MWPVIPEQAIAYPRTTVHATAALGCFRGNPTSTAWPTANKAIFSPFYLSAPITVAQLFVTNGTVVSGNIDVGLYAVDGTRLASAGTTAQAGTSTLQVFNITDIRIGPGVYYLAVALDNTTGTVEGITAATIGTAMLRAIGYAEQTTAFVLPATATLATLTANLAPICGLTTNAIL
jgi:hypothetical protein